MKEHLSQVVRAVVEGSKFGLYENNGDIVFGLTTPESMVVACYLVYKHPVENPARFTVALSGEESDVETAERLRSAMATFEERLRNFGVWKD